MLVLLTAIVLAKTCQGRQLMAAYDANGEIIQGGKPQLMSSRRYLLTGMFGNLNNQRQCLLQSLELAKQWNLTFVLPHWQLDFDDVPAGQQLPYTFFYQAEALREYGQRQGISIADQLPAELWPACSAQLRRGNAAHLPGPVIARRQQRMIEFLQAQNQTNLICLTDKAAFNLSGLHNLELAAGYDAVPYLKPSQPWQKLLDTAFARLHSKFGNLSRGYPVLHARVEEEWQRACQQWGCRLGNISCWISPAEIAHSLHKDFGLAEGSPLLVLTGAPVATLGPICSVYKCITKSDLLEGVEIADDLMWHKYNSRAFFDFQLARAGTAFFGNMYSTFSTELVEEYKLAGKGPAAHYMNKPRIEC